MFPVEAGDPHAPAVRAPGHAAEVAAAGGRGRGGVPDRGGGQRHAGGPQPGGHEGLTAHPAEDGREVRTSSSTRGSINLNTLAEKCVLVVILVVLVVVEVVLHYTP